MKNFKKGNLLITIIGVTAFVIGNILQSVNEEYLHDNGLITGLNELTYFGAILLGLSLMIWLIIADLHVFTDWNWLKTRTKSDDIAALGVFILTTPIFLSFDIFILYDLISWYDWYTLENYSPLYQLIHNELLNLGSNMVFWFTLISIISLSAGLAIFLYKAKIKKIETTKS